MKVKLIIPKWPEGSVWSRFVFRFPYMGVTTLAAIVPPGVEVSIADENVEAIDFDEGADLVGISALTPLAPRGYEIADAFRKRGAKVAIGGVHATWMPEEAGEHADCVVIGEAEAIWPRLIEDFKAGALKPRYRASGYPPIGGIPPARMDLLRGRGYLFKNLIQTTRGCPHDCDFCSVTALFGKTYRCRPLEDIEAELKAVRGGAKFVFFVDDNIYGNRSHAKSLLELLKRYPFKWVSQASVKFADDPELLKLARETRCHGLLIGFESLSEEGLAAMNKRHNRVEKYKDVIKSLHDHGIGVHGAFIFGHDEDTKGSFDAVMEFSHKTRLDGGLFSLLTPYPGTRVFEKMKAEGRLLHTDWRKYDMAHVVFRPKNMSVEELEDGYLRINREFYSWPSMLRRLPALRRSIFVFGPMNIGLRRLWRGYSY